MKDGVPSILQAKAPLGAMLPRLPGLMPTLERTGRALSLWLGLQRGSGQDPNSWWEVGRRWKGVQGLTLMWKSYHHPMGPCPPSGVQNLPLDSQTTKLFIPPISN